MLQKFNTDHESRLNISERLLKRILKKLQINAVDKEGKLTLDMKEEQKSILEGEEPKQEEFGIEDHFKLLNQQISQMQDRLSTHEVQLSDESF